MARLAVNLGDMVRMGKFLDVGVTVIALQAAVDAGAELVTVDGDAMPLGVLHGLVTVASQAIGLRRKSTGPEHYRDCDHSQGNCLGMSNHS